MKQRYADFDVLLEPRGDGFVSRVLDSPVGSTGPEEFVPPDSAGVTDLVQGLRDLRRITPAQPEMPNVAGSPTAAIKAFGTQLFEALFTGGVESALRSSLHVSAKHNEGLRLRLRFAETPDLTSLPWELLYDPVRRRFPCRQDDFPTVRVVDIPEPIAPLTLSGPIRMIVAISSPIDLPQLDVEAEWQRLTTTLAPLTASGRLELERLDQATLEALRVAATDGEFHVFHFIGHGGVDPESGEGLLAFNGPTGRAQLEPCSHVADLLGNSPIELAVLNSCEGGRVTAVDPYGSSALTLVEHGIPAVVAMQFEISDVAATAFSGVLYERVTAGAGIDLAVTLARQAILTASPTEWSTPVLYLRPEGSRLFSRSDEPPPPPPPPALPDPAAPVIVTAQARGETVHLAWHQPPVPGVTVTEWRVSRNGIPQNVIYQPSFIDTPGGQGVYGYSVVAVSATGQPSGESAVASVRLRARMQRWFFNERGRPRVGVWLLAAFLAFSVVVGIVSTVTPVAAPSNVQVVDTSPVTLVWDSPSIWSPVDQWQVFRDGDLLGTTRSPRWRDDTPLTGTHRY
ncbi:MAG TPA: CHAT domain-containing protein, partial [Intrasporangium sp.]|nr:CHAT domain-containing protein [Intrasporangium sp.]